jgi:pyruvate/2-oxoglutarate dehydrogenase complex dihydrolipoamide acyltransferase (E2) component
MVLHGVVMLAGGLAFGLAVVRAGVLPRWTGWCLMLGVVLVVSASGLSNVARTVAAALPATAFAGMGWALLTRRPRVSHPRPASSPTTDDVTVRPFPSSRRLVLAAVRAGRRIVPMYGLFEVDVTEARRHLAETDPPLSLTAFLVATLGRAAALHPQVHAYRDWRGRLVQHHRVHVQTLIEVPTAQGPFGLVHVVRDADVRSVADISAELRAVQADPASTASGRLLDTVAPLAGRVPGLYRALFAVLSRSRRAHRASGTVQVSAVGMFADGGGFAIAPPSLASLSVVVGGLSRRLRDVGGHVEVRDVLDLTVTIDHTVVDGAPATRFGAQLRQLLHSAAALDPVPEPVAQRHLMVGGPVR